MLNFSFKKILLMAVGLLLSDSLVTYAADHYNDGLDEEEALARALALSAEQHQKEQQELRRVSALPLPGADRYQAAVPNVLTRSRAEEAYDRQRSILIPGFELVLSAAGDNRAGGFGRDRALDNLGEAGRDEQRSREVAAALRRKEEARARQAALEAAAAKERAVGVGADRGPDNLGKVVSPEERSREIAAAMQRKKEALARQALAGAPTVKARGVVAPLRDPVVHNEVEEGS
ncbi:MAG: hypothetical protein K0R52_1175 [Alphaproteobacteria bacterium]|jgi:hypothetical protein|nr:hypothetical protein [Alphaproteobacteria bacterium]